MDIHTLRLGEVKVSYVPDGAVDLDAHALLPDWPSPPDILTASIGGLLVERGDRALLIDAGYGPRSEPAQPGNLPGAIGGGALLDNLALLGRDPATIETVAFTHLHIDHVGWAWGSSPFTSFVVSEPEWTGRRLAELHGTPSAALSAIAPKVRTVADGEEIFPGVRAMLTIGHTVGHTTYVINTGAQRLIAFGDALHAPIQVEHPEWSSTFDLDPVQSAIPRRRLVSVLSQPGTIGYGNHFTGAVFGRIGADGAWHRFDG